MAAIAMPPAADFNVKADKNVGCWTCEHFQHYGETSQNGQVQMCEGECRKQPPKAGAFRKDLEKPSDWPIDGYFTYIPFGNIAWCNGYQRALDTSQIPTSPGAHQSDCPHQDPLTWVPPDINRGPSQPNKKPIEETCWFCDHFQRLTETVPANPQANAAEYCHGYCQNAPQPDYTYQEGAVEDKDLAWQTFPLFTKIEYGPVTWCSRWERATHEVPPVPADSSQVVCAVSGP